MCERRSKGRVRNEEVKKRKVRYEEEKGERKEFSSWCRGVRNKMSRVVKTRSK